MTLAELTAAFWMLQALLGTPDLAAVQPTPQHQELAATADKLRDYAEWYTWAELPHDTRAALVMTWGKQR